MNCADDSPPHPSFDLDLASRALFRLGRAFGRLPRRELLDVSSARDVELSAILVVQAVETGKVAGREVTVGEVAAQLGIDPSTASRLVAQSVDGGYLRRVTAQGDRRAIAMELTAKGRELDEGAARYQRAVFDEATADWSDGERREFARLFLRFAEAIMADLKGQEKDQERER